MPLRDYTSNIGTSYPKSILELKKIKQESLSNEKNRGSAMK
jgi:hypothetical protein